MKFSKNEIKDIIETDEKSIRPLALLQKKKYYGDSIYIRGLIEFTNYCKNNCYYCGIRHKNKNIQRYRLSKKDILDCCEAGYSKGFRTFVLQGGEDPFFTDSVMCEIIDNIKTRFPGCAVTLSLGERSNESYKALKSAGADRYLLRHETADNLHYSKLHPKDMLLENRKRCLYSLKKIGFQIGAGFMVGSPYQTVENLISDLVFLDELQPHMVGIGPFIAQKDSPFAEFKNGTLERTLTMLALIRIILPKTLLPATTALGTIAKNGQELGFMSGANVVMPNLSPKDARENYALYDNKKNTGTESAQGLEKLRLMIEKSGFKMDMSVGNSLMC